MTLANKNFLSCHQSPYTINIDVHVIHRLEYLISLLNESLYGMREDGVGTTTHQHLVRVQYKYIQE